MFKTNVPVTANAFFNRRAELERLAELTDSLLAGSPRWLAIIGRRKVGKTSILLELRRCMSGRKSPVFVIIDTFEEQPLSPGIFRRFALRFVDAVFSIEAGVSLEAAAVSPADYRAALQTSNRFSRLQPQLRARILELPERKQGPDFVKDALSLPEDVATSLGISVLVAWDEFQELGDIVKGMKAKEVFSLMRAVWQRHTRVAYIISGSARTMLTNLVSSEASPFFQHFDMMSLGDLPEEDALKLLIESSPETKKIPKSIAARAVSVLGGHPFYLQLIGETLTSRPGPYDEAAFKCALQDLLFSGTGRLSLYFENEFRKLVGRSTFLAAVLESLCDGPKRLVDISNRTGATAGAAIRYIERIGDAVVRTPNGLYQLDDPVFGLWLKWRRPGGTVMPMALLGDDAEKAVAFSLSRMGFDLVYQSRASRGSFDLLATRGHIQLGVQVKRAPLPLRFTKTEWNRMDADAARFGWSWVVAALDPKSEETRFLDPKKASVKRQVVLNLDAKIDNVLMWLGR